MSVTRAPRSLAARATLLPLALLLVLLAAPGASAERDALHTQPTSTSGHRLVAPASFTLAVVPDTQTEVFGDDTRLRDRLDWLVSRRENLDLRFVAHVGDLTNWGWLARRQLTKASDALSVLEEAGLPYALAVGNHDTRAVGWDGHGGYGGRPYADNPECVERFLPEECTTERLLRHTEEINGVFDAARFGAVAGAFEEGKIDNIYSTFDADGLSWLVLDLEMWPRPDVVEWANEVVASHPDHNVVVNTHMYASATNQITRNAGYGDTSPRTLWNRLLSRHPNIVLVVSGHVQATAATRVDVGRHGNQVVTLLTAFADSGTNPARLVRFNTARGVLSTRFIAPATGERYVEHRARVEGLTFVG